MICKKKPAEKETLTCKTCVTPWHLTCLSSSSSTPPQTLLLAPYALKWDCPDCSSEMALVSGRSKTSSSSSGNLIVAIRMIELGQSLTHQEKAKRRQDLLMSSSG
ncbi:E3 ubiquitin-protein ligase ORTHRUS 2 [Camellia lanceoleosa]|uniref:E3 ubiquitin-protein ligase ORTHRUS 2 n=1 Tax=Camellia lanceoleosa TaxID=1840588 RepID=A0ACC0I7I4_9ERIC|nr:E3 ubiquitin-protein ligase ORTHRUS 2 [Camellia lanceoleosa]